MLSMLLEIPLPLWARVFAIGSAALVSLALYGAFVVRIQEGGLTPKSKLCNLSLSPFSMVGSMLPYWFPAMTKKSVKKAAMNLLVVGTTNRPDSKVALREMIAPFALVILSPLIAGTFFGNSRSMPRSNHRPLQYLLRLRRN